VQLSLLNEESKLCEDGFRLPLPGFRLISRKNAISATVV
jgi:hypothetical protein